MIKAANYGRRGKVVSGKLGHIDALAVAGLGDCYATGSGVGAFGDLHDLWHSDSLKAVKIDGVQIKTCRTDRELWGMQIVLFIQTLLLTPPRTPECLVSNQRKLCNFSLPEGLGQKVVERLIHETFITFWSIRVNACGETAMDDRYGFGSHSPAMMWRMLPNSETVTNCSDMEI